MSRKSLILFFSILLMVVALGCSSDDADDNNNNNNADGDTEDSESTDNDSSSASESASKSITAADGGSVATPSGAAGVDIPAGALSEDKEITIQAKDKAGAPDAANLGSNLYEFGPDGLQFSSPVTLSLAFDGTVPTDKKAVLAVLDGTAWTTIEGSALKDGKVSGSVEHFSTYVILFIDDKMVITTKECADFTFTACGGDPVGVWNIQDICYLGQIMENPFEGVKECESIEYVIGTSYTGDFEFKSDGTYSILGMKYGSKVNIKISEACLVAKYPNHSGQESCDGIGENDTIQSCTFANAECTCVGDDNTGTAPDNVGTWSVEGNNLTMTKEGEEGKTGEFCVDGNNLYTEMDTGKEDTKAYTILVKK